MSRDRIISTYDKTLKINLDAAKYGTFAEIGAGQGVAEWFFKASGTAGTVAKTISAYDMTMSDEIYGKCDRYVSRGRVTAMLDHEYSLLDERLSSSRGATSTFFCYCNTVRARGYQDTGECHGWMGIRLQLKPNGQPCDILCHVRLLDDENLDQMNALGILGVNLIYAAFYHRDNLEDFVESLMDGLNRNSIEVDMLKFLGDGFKYVDNRLCLLQLVQSGLTDAAMFTPEGEVVQPAEVLYKRPIALLRGSFNPVTNLHLDMMEQTKKKFFKQLDDEQQGRYIGICEISMHNLLRGSIIDHVDFLDRADALQSLGKTVLISRCPEFHKIATYLNRYTDQPIAISLSIELLNELFKEKWSENLAGGILESFGRLFKNKLSLLVYPWKNRKTGELVNTEVFRVKENLKHLYQYFRENNMIQSLECSDENLLAFTGRDIQKLIKNGDKRWKDLVPEIAHKAAKNIRK